MKMIKLYRVINNVLTPVDYGVEAQIDSYLKQGYTVIVKRDGFIIDWLEKGLQ